MDLAEITKRAEEIAKKYNPEGVSPFPFDHIEEDVGNLDIVVVDFQEGISGAISYEKEDSGFTIMVDKNKAKTRQYFTVAHELGHYFLHADVLKNEEVIVDSENAFEWNRILYRLDNSVSTRLEAEANAFAAALIMPADLVKKAWEAFHSIEECAKIFDVSASAMSIRLEKLGFVS